MRELHGGHGDHGRHARDAHPPADTPAARAHDGPKHAAQDAVKLRMLTDPAFRMAERLKYAQRVEARNAEYAARHAKSQNGDQASARQQLQPQESRPDHAPPESRDKPAGKIVDRDKPLDRQQEERHTRHRSWLPRADVVKTVTDTGLFVAAVAVAIGDASARWEPIAAYAANAVVSHITLANRRRKEKHGDRPEG